MTTKTFEVRDVGTFIPVLAIRLDPVDERDRYLLAMAGYGTTPEAQREYVILMPLIDTSKATYDVYAWGGGRARTYPIAHKHIIDNFDALPNGAVVCVEYLLGERLEPKVTQAFD